MVKDHHSDCVQAVFQLARVPGGQNTIFQSHVVPCHLSPANRNLANAVLHLIVGQIVDPCAAVDGHHALDQITIARLGELHSWSPPVHLASFARWLGLAIGFCPAAKLGWVDFEELGSHHVLRAELTDALSAHTADAHIGVNVTRLVWRGARKKDLLLSRRALVGV